MTNRIVRIWLLCQYIISTLLITAVKSDCVNTTYCNCDVADAKIFKYKCGNHFPGKQIEVHIDQFGSGGKIEIRCTQDYNGTDYINIDRFKDLKDDVTARIEHFEITHCPAPAVSFVKIFNIFSTKPVTHFTFTQSKVPFILEPYHFENLSSLSTLELQNSKIEKLPEQFFENLTNLKSLYLNGNDLQTLPRKIFDSLIKLERLSLAQNNISFLDENIFQHNTELKELILSTNKLDNLPKSIFDSLDKLNDLHLNRNDMTILNDGIFDNLKNLDTLYLRYNELMRVPERPFVNNSKLRIISMDNALDKNNFTFPPRFFFNLTSLEELHLAMNNLTDLPNELFQLGSKNNLTELDLSDNQLSQLDDKLFDDLRSLTKLNIKNNRLIRVTPRLFLPLAALEDLNLSFNQLTMETSDPDNSALNNCCNNLRELDLNHNNLTKVFQDFRESFNHLEKLRLNHNKFGNLTPEDFNFSYAGQMIITFDNNNITNINLTGTEKLYNSNTLNLKTFSIKNNPIKCDCNALSLAKHFKTAKKSGILILSNNVSCNAPQSLKNISLENVMLTDLKCPLHEINRKQNNSCTEKCRCEYRSVDDTVEVNCTSTGMNKFPLEIPKGYKVELLLDKNNLKSIDGLNKLPEDVRKTITKLSLSHNQLENINSIQWQWLTGLKILELDNNKLSHLKYEVTEQMKLLAKANLTSISLHKNPWRCDCDAKYLLEFMRYSDRNKALQIPFYHEIQCEDDGFSFTNLTEENLCHTSSIPIYASVALCTFGLVSGAIMALYYRYQHEIKVWMFAHKIFRWFVTEKEVDKDKIFDAFVSFSHKDQDFVDKHLIPQLEKGNDHNYKLCIHYRDFIVGEFIPSQIVHFVENSRRTIIVLTPNFLESVWGRMEFRTAHLKAIKEGCARVIIVLLEDVSDEKLDPELKAYITMNTYVKWGDPLFWKKLKYALPHPQRAKRRCEADTTVLMQLMREHQNQNSLA